MERGILGRGQLWAWARHSVPVLYFLGLMAWEVIALSLDDPMAVALGLLSLAYMALIVACYLRRGPGDPLKRGDWLAQFIALLGANLLIPLSLLPSVLPEMLAVATGVLGLGISFWAVWHLGTAFSLVPEARHLVTSGPYHWVRHPLYLAGFIIGLGLLVVKLSPGALGLFLGFALSQGLRMAYEEDVLAASFPAYEVYRKQTKSLLPGLW